MSGTVEVVCALVFHAGRLLLCRRAPGRREAGFWEFPGGKVEPGESRELALQREMLEELGMHCAVGASCAESVFRYAHGTIHLVALYADWLHGEPQLRDHDAFAWVSSDELPGYSLAPADIPIAESCLALWRESISAGKSWPSNSNR